MREANPQMGPRQRGEGPHPYRKHRGHTKLAAWRWVGKVKIRQWTGNRHLDLPALLPVLGSISLSSCSSEFYRCESEDAGEASRECTVMGTLGFYGAGLTAEQIQVFQSLIHLAKDLWNTCFVLGIMLKPGDTQAVSNLIGNVKHAKDS